MAFRLLATSLAAELDRITNHGRVSAGHVQDCDGDQAVEADGSHQTTAQIIGGMIGVRLAHVMFELPVWRVSLHRRSGTGEMTRDHADIHYPPLSGLDSKP
jgi:hypothetical protein